MVRKLIVLFGIALAVGSVASAVFAQRNSERTPATAARGVRMAQMMHGGDGVVSRDEYMNFMSRMYDRLDANKNGTLEPEELEDLTFPTYLLGVN
jgi:hypothetical protein